MTPLPPREAARKVDSARGEGNPPWFVMGIKLGKYMTHLPHLIPITTNAMKTQELLEIVYYRNYYLFGVLAESSVCWENLPIFMVYPTLVL